MLESKAKLIEMQASRLRLDDKINKKKKNKEEQKSSDQARGRANTVTLTKEQIKEKAKFKLKQAIFKFKQAIECYQMLPINARSQRGICRAQEGICNVRRKLLDGYVCVYLVCLVCVFCFGTDIFRFFCASF